MKKIVFYFILFLTAFSAVRSEAQVLCIFCYEQNAPLSTGISNLIENGSFENGCLVGGHFNPIAFNHNCDITSWTCIPAGVASYPEIENSSIDGVKAAYFGNSFANVCSSTPYDTSCLYDVGCTVAGVQSTIANSSMTGVRLMQTVNGLIPGNIYVLEFWAGGEASFFFTERSVFAVDVGFGNITLREKAEEAYGGDGTRYVIEFRATSSSHTIKFTNWGHICQNCTELILDDVRLYTLAELSPVVPYCNPDALIYGYPRACPGSCFDLQAVPPSVGTPPFNYSWTPNIGTGQGPFEVCPDTTTTYSVLITDANNIYSTASLTTVITPLLTLTIDNNNITNASCGNLNGSITNTYSGGNLPYSYLWSTNPPQATPSIKNLGAGIYTVTVTDATSCSATASYTIKAVALPEVIVTGDTDICIGESTTLTAYGAWSYTWLSVSSGSNTIIVQPTTTHVYSVVGITLPNFCRDTGYVTVTVNSLPTVRIIANDGNNCSPNTIYTGYGSQEIMLTAVSDNAVSYLWSTGAISQSIAATAGGAYSVTVYDANGCASQQTPQSQIIINAIDIRCGQNLQKVILCHVPPGNSANPQTICISSSAIPAHLALHPDDCLGPCSLYFSNRAADSIDENPFVYAYPSPFNNGFHLSFFTFSSNYVLVKIFDVSGRIIETYNDVTEQTLIGTKLNTGIYFAEVIQDDNRQMIQIVKSE